MDSAVGIVRLERVQQGTELDLYLFRAELTCEQPFMTSTDPRVQRAKNSVNFSITGDRRRSLTD